MNYIRLALTSASVQISSFITVEYYITISSLRTIKQNADRDVKVDFDVISKYRLSTHRGDISWEALTLKQNKEARIYMDKKRIMQHRIRKNIRNKKKSK